MKNKTIITGILFGSLLISVPAAQSRVKQKNSHHTATQKPYHIKYKAPPDEVVADLLGWTPSDDPACSVCGGYYKEPKIIRDNPNPLPYEDLPTHITARGPTIFSQSGQSILQKDVRVTQPGRLSTADKAYIFRDRNSGKITRIKLVGNVHLQESGNLMVSHKATLNLKNQTAEISNGVYHIHQTNKRMGNYDAWGTAEHIKRFPDGIIKLQHASFSTCVPTKPSWQLSASRIKIDQKNNRATAKNAVVRLHGIPILWAPYFSFSTNNARKSGLLGPLIQNSSRSGFTWTQPYYFNLAPNVDFLFDATYMSKRGLQANSLFRYLTETSHGNLFLSFIPDDREFRRFKQDTFAQFPEPISDQYQPYINALRKNNNDRGYLAFNNDSVFNDKWTSEIQLNYVTDPYYFRDFGPSVNDVVANQLLNQATLHYTGMHWNFTFLAQAYQTLHLINQSTEPTVNQYMRLPELDVSGEYPNIFSGVNFDINMQAVNFDYYSAFPPTTDEMPAGQRFHLNPTFSRPINWASGYLTPSIAVDSTNYNVTRLRPGLANESSRNIPYADVDSGFYFNRLFHIGHDNYYQTFEPRLFYLYVPFVNQDKYPNYDTQVLPFTYEQLFSTNRFTGFDRFQNADQISLGITSRIIDADDAFQRLKADIGLGYYFSKPKVCLTPGCGIDNQEFTPIVTQLTYYPAKYWSTSGSFAWDIENHQTNNAQFDINYSSDGRHIIGGGYTFVHAQPGAPPYSSLGFTNDSSLYNVHVAWPITNNWSALGYIYYNVSQKRAETYFAGLQYDSCCWSLRFIVERTYMGTLPVNSGAEIINKYNTNYIVQLQLKGIGSAGNTNPNALLISSIPGYSDPFKY